MDTNGTTVPLASMREDIERAELGLRSKELAMRKRVMEQTEGWWQNFVNPSEPLFDTPDFYYPFVGENLPFNIDNQLRGELLPVYRTEWGLKVLRDYSRWLAAYNPYAINVLQNRVNY